MTPEHVAHWCARDKHTDGWRDGLLRTLALPVHAVAMARGRLQTVFTAIVSLLAISSGVSAAPALFQALPGECRHVLLYFSQSIVRDFLWSTSSPQCNEWGCCSMFDLFRCPWSRTWPLLR